MTTAFRLAAFTDDQRQMDDLGPHFDHWLYAIGRLDSKDGRTGAKAALHNVSLAPS